MRNALVLSALVSCAHSATPPSKSTAAAPRAGTEAQLTPDMVVAKVRGGYAVGVQRCYTRYLKNRSGHGRVLVTFTVDETGRAQDGAATGVPPQLGSCIVAEVARWRFPPPHVAQSFALPLDLVIN